MNAPKKIYLQDSMSTDTIGELWPEWFDAKVSDNSIEYTRTDAFIEKLEKWLKEHILDYAQELNYGVGKSQPDYYTKHFIEDVKNFMKGE